jgi:hypothetical protein
MVSASATGSASASRGLSVQGSIVSVAQFGPSIDGVEEVVEEAIVDRRGVTRVSHGIRNRVLVSCV